MQVQNFNTPARFQGLQAIFFNLLFCEVSSVRFFLYERRAWLDFVPLSVNHFMYDSLFANHLHI